MVFRPVLAAVIPIITLAACSTDTLVNDKVFASGDGCAPGVPSGTLVIASYLPKEDDEKLHVRLNGQDLIVGPEDTRWIEFESPGGSTSTQVPVGDYTIDLVDNHGRLLATAGPVTVIPDDLYIVRDRHSSLRVYGDWANPSVFISDPTEHDTSAETTEVTVRNGVPTGEAIIVSRCVTAGVFGQPDPCEDLATVPNDGTWSGMMLNSAVGFPFIGEAYASVRLDAPDAAPDGTFSVNQNPENFRAYGTGCQATGVLVYDVLTLQCDGRREAIAVSDCGWD